MSLMSFFFFFPLSSPGLFAPREMKRSPLACNNLSIFTFVLYVLYLCTAVG